MDPLQKLYTMTLEPTVQELILIKVLLHKLPMLKKVNQACIVREQSLQYPIFRNKDQAK